jgi:hypothetical protein
VRVLSIHKGADTAGIGWLLTLAFARLSTDVRLRSAVRRSNYIDYPHDLPWTAAAAEWARADVVHLHNTLGTWRLMGADRPVLLHHHGTYYRENAAALNKAVADLGGRAVVSTLDLLGFGDDLTWIPAPFDLDWLAGFRKPQGGRLRVGHAPTDRGVKSTEAFLAACRRLDVEPVLIERRAWRDCLAIKGTCDVLFDQVRLGYGHNAIEAWGMGIPVIAGADDVTEDRMVATFGGLPFYPATEATIDGAIRDMMRPDVREEFAACGLDHVRRWHDGRATVDVLTALYSSLVVVGNEPVAEGAERWHSAALLSATGTAPS